ncbi:MAG: saccharopine dehydrogenase NADP-binding domain-containing protein [Eubacteriales bacterium]|nr:saccharopine dehydrogenase NADP-binding domain-containing protein [Eubacteriales bacterium]
MKYNVDTRLVFQVGDPMDQGCATFLHNAMYSYANLNAVCVTAVIPKGGLPPFIEAVRTLGADGFDLTMPHKTDILAYLDECDEASRAFRCVNHVKLRGGRLIGTGLDGAGMGMSVEAKLGADVKGRHLLLIGAGAVAGPIAADLCMRGVSRVTIVNRTVEKAKYIAETLGRLYGVPCEYAPLCAEALNELAPQADLVVQCTSLGGGSWGSLESLDFVTRLPKHCAAADVLYPDTEFLQKARQAGLQTIDGRGMLFYQQLAMIDFRFGVKLPPAALLEAEEAVELAVAMRELRNRRLRA